MNARPIPTAPKGLRQFLDPEQQRAWMEGKASLPDTAERSESLEQRFKYAARFEKLLKRPQADEVIAILRLYAERCLPIPRATERSYWSVSCLPSTNDKPLARVNASWMELFTLLPDEDHPPRHLPGRGTGEAGGGALRARFILHLSDFTYDRWAAAGTLSPGGRGQGEGARPLSGKAVRPHPNPPPAGEREKLVGEPDQLDQDLLEQCVARPEDVSHFFWKGDTLGVKVRGQASIRAFLAHPHALRAIRRFNLTHTNRGRNAYAASHCYSLADEMLP